MATTRPERRRAARLARAGASGVALLSIGVAASAATSPAVEPSVSVSAVATDNSQLTTADQRRADLIGDVNAGLLLHSIGPRVTLTGDAGLEFIGYARHTNGDAVLPRGSIDLNTTLVERTLFFDGNLSATRTRNDPLAAQSDTASTANTVSTVSLRASPYFLHEFTPTLSAAARSDTTITRNKSADPDGTPAPVGSTNRHDTASLVRKPEPFGLSIDALHDDTTYQRGGGSVLRTDSLQATVDTALPGDLVAGLVGGYEHAVYTGIVQNDTTYGASLQWHPSSRTSLDADAEHHYFGTGWNLHLRDRMPLSMVDLTLTRMASASASSFGVSGPDSNPAALLGAILSARMPDAASTDSAVDTATQAGTVPSSFSAPLQITSESPQLATRATLNFVYNGLRNSVYASTWYQKAVALPGAAATPLATTFDSRQSGGSLGLNHRLSPEMAAAAQVEWSQIEALGARAGDSSHQLSGTLSLTERLGPRTSLSCGVRRFISRVVLNSTSTTTDVHEDQAFAGLRVQY